MALDARLEAYIGRNGSIIRKYRGVPEKGLERVKASTATLFLGAGVQFTAEAVPTVKLAVLGEISDGVIVGTVDGANDLTKDSDSPYAINTWLWMYKPQEHDEVYGISKTNVSITFNFPVQFDGGFLVMWAYVNATEATDVLIGVVGAAMKAVTAAADTEKALLYKWGRK